MQDDRIVPGERIGPFVLGMEEADALTHLGPAEREDMDGMFVLFGRDYALWFDAEDRVLTQVGVHGGFSGRLPTLGDAAGIGVGSTLDELGALGTIAYDDDDGVFLIADMPGVCFEVDDALVDAATMGASEPEWLRIDGEWPIDWICVFAADLDDEDEGD
jgi:hypothetical protein